MLAVLEVLTSEIFGLKMWSRTSNFSPRLAQLRFQTMQDLSDDELINSYSLLEKSTLLI